MNVTTAFEFCHQMLQLQFPHIFDLQTILHCGVNLVDLDKVFS